jgi:hypothetical protein
MKQFFDELKRRNVVRVGFAYLVVGWLVFQVGEVLFPMFCLTARSTQGRSRT